jgi:hypothetical protein
VQAFTANAPLRCGGITLRNHPTNETRNISIAPRANKKPETRIDLVQRQATAVILGCTHFEYFEREFATLLLAARNSVISPSGALAVALMDAFGEYTETHLVQPIGQKGRNDFAFSGGRPPLETFQGLSKPRPRRTDLNKPTFGPIQRPSNFG